jgi:prepilin-type N-terminal cleavage/methylation domain-containing protein
VREAFTLIELLVVLVILTLVMAVVVPQGAKMLSGYERSLAKIKAKQKISKMRAKAFLQAKDINITIDTKNYLISKKGVVLESRHDNY